MYYDGTKYVPITSVLSYTAGTSTLALQSGKHFGLSASSNFGLYGTTPIAQPVGSAQNALGGALTGVTNDTLADVASSAWGATQADSINKNFKEVQELVNALRTALVNLGIIKGSA